MIRILSILVVGLFAIMWASGNDVQSVKEYITHWAEGSGRGVSPEADDWGH